MITDDKTLECRECHNGFIWSAKEQEFFALKGFYPPKRCKTCIATGYRASDGMTAEERAAKQTDGNSSS